MNKEEQFIFWQNGLFNAIKNVSDIERQKYLWSGKSTKFISSFTEVVIVLYDDFDFEGYIEYLEQTNSDIELLVLMKELDGLISLYIDITIDLNIEDDMQILIDDRWIEITNKAKYLYDLIQVKYKHKYSW